MMKQPNPYEVYTKYVYIDTAGKLGCFDLARRKYRVRSTSEIRHKLLEEAD